MQKTKGMRIYRIPADYLCTINQTEPLSPTFIRIKLLSDLFCNKEIKLLNKHEPNHSQVNPTLPPNRSQIDMNFKWRVPLYMLSDTLYKQKAHDNNLKSCQASARDDCRL